MKYKLRGTKEFTIERRLSAKFCVSTPGPPELCLAR